MSEIVIRIFAPEDAPAFYALNLEWLETYFQVEAKDNAMLSDPQGSILHLGGAIFMADMDSNTVGCVAMLPMGDGSFEVAKMAVSPEVQGKGIGRKLMEAAVAWAREQGASRLYLESNLRLTPALRLYESVGFRHLPPERRPVSPYVRADVFMEMQLIE